MWIQSVLHNRKHSQIVFYLFCQLHSNYTLAACQYILTFSYLHTQARVTLADKQVPNWRRKAIVLQSAPAVVRDPWFPSVPVMDVFILAITPLCYSTVSRQRDQNNSPEPVSTPLRWRGEIYSPVCPHTHWTCSLLIGRCGSCDFT